jgi:acyl-CoA thioesterase-1
MSKAQVVCIGASTQYGIGGTKGGWADLIKQDLHQQMYGEGGAGEQHELYNLGVPGAALNAQVERAEVALRTIRKPGRTLITVFQGGANNAIAVDRPDNFVSTPEDYKKELDSFLDKLVELSDHVICVGMLPMDQQKVMPISNDNEKGRKVYFSNERIKQFEDVFSETAQSKGLTFIPLFAKGEQAGWVDAYQYVDGIHPNDKGHQWIKDQVQPKILELLD